MIRARTAALTSGLVAFCLLIARFGFPPDSYIWITFAVFSACVGTVGAGVVSGIRHVRSRPRLAAIAGLLLVVGSVPFVWRFQSARATLPTFLATADSVAGHVQGHNADGNLLYHVRDTLHGGRHMGRFIAPKNRAHDSLSAGDTVWVFVHPTNPRKEVGRSGPDGRLFLKRFAIAWFVAAALISGYGPYFIPRRKLAPSDPVERHTT